MIEPPSAVSSGGAALANLDSGTFGQAEQSKVGR